MMPNPSHVIVTAADYPFDSSHGVCVHHGDFPEVRGEGGSPEDAAERLLQLLSQTLNTRTQRLCRESLERAIEDVRAFAKRQR